MARKTELDVDLVESEVLELENLVPVRNVVRWISRRGVTEQGTNTPGYHSVSDIEEHLAGLYDIGYVLFDTHYLGDNPTDEAYGIMYIMVLKSE